MAANLVDLSALWRPACTPPLVLDVRDPHEVAAGKGGPPGSITGAVNVPLNVAGAKQSDHLTTQAEFVAKLAAAGVTLPADKAAAVVTHCGSGGRGGKAAGLLAAMGCTNVFNGGGPATVAAAMALSAATSGRSLTAAEVANLVQHERSATATIVGFGSLLSAASAAGTCPGVAGFRLGRVDGWRRVFAHPAAVFFERGIAVAATKEVASLSAEPAPAGTGFVVAVFEIPIVELAPLLVREEEFNFVRVAVAPLPDCGEPTGPPWPATEGWMCTRSSDADVLNRPGLREKYAGHLEPAFGSSSIWGWAEDSGILPCPVYCRHCVLASRREGVPAAAATSFLDETFLSDRKTTLRQYLTGAGAHVMDSVVPPGLEARYNG